MCLRRSVYRDRATHKNLAALLSEITFLIAYFEIEETSRTHLILRKGLNQLAQASPDEDLKDYIYAVQMSGHLLYALGSLPAYDPEATAKIIGHAEYAKLKNCITKLQNEFPIHDKIGDHEQLKEYAAEIERILYRDVEMQDASPSFRQQLYKYLNDNRKSISEILRPVQQWASEDHVGLRFHPEGIIETKGNELFVVFNDEMVETVFGELTNNMRRAQARWQERQTQPEILYDITQFPVAITISHTIDTITLEITSPCTYQEFNDMQGGEGIGLAQIRIALQIFGHIYHPARFDEANELLTQRLEMRRIHK
jgi:hypothetical protein